MVEVLAPSVLTPTVPGIEIVGETRGPSGTSPTRIREGSNLSVHYCLGKGLKAADSWVGIFTLGTADSELTKDNAGSIGYWLTIGEPENRQECGDVAAFASELAAGQTYEVRLLHERPDGTSTPVGRKALFAVTPSLPH